MSLSAEIKTGLLLLALTLFFTACEDPNEIGLELTGDPNRIGAYYEEIELSTSLINNDSLLTSSVVRLLAGEIYNPEFGSMTASAYTQFGYSSAALKIPEDATYDSLVLDIRNDYSFGNDINLPQRFYVHELQEDLYDTAAYFSFSSLEYDPSPIGYAEFQLGELPDTVLSIRLDDTYGQRLFDAAKDTNTIDPGDVSSLQELFKGFSILSDESNNVVMGINAVNDSTALRLYYTFEDSTYNYPFVFEGVGNFNTFATDRTGTPLQGLDGFYYQDFQPSNNKAYIQSGADLVTKIDFTPLLDFFDTIEYVSINQALINITIDEPGVNELPPSSVSFYYTNESNKRIRTSGGFQGILEEGSTDLLRAFLDPDGTYYMASVTLFTDNLINGRSDNIQVLMYPPDFGISNTVNQMLASPGNIKLQIYYSKVK